MNSHDVLQIICGTSIATLVGVIIIFFTVINQLETVFRVWQWLATLLFRLKFLGAKRKLQHELTSLLNQGILHLQSEAPVIFAKSIRLKLINGNKDIEHLENGEVIIYIQSSSDRDRILADATMFYLQNTVITDSRPYVDHNLLRAFDVTLAEKALAGIQSAYSQLVTSYRDPLINDSKTAAYIDLADALEAEGVLTRIVLRELSGLGIKHKGKRSTARIRQETISFSKFVEKIANRSNEDVPLRFIGQEFKTTIALVARTSQVEKSGLELYKRKFVADIKNGTRTIYLLAKGRDNVILTKYLARWALENEFVSKILPNDFNLPTPTGKPVIANCIACLSAHAETSIQLNPVDEVFSALATIVPETLYGSLDIVGVQREQHKRTKIMVRSNNGENPVPYFIGHRGSNVEKLKAILETSEEIDFVNGNAPIKAQIIGALYPLREDEVFEVKIHPDMLRAIVTVKSKDLIGVAIGTKGVNVNLAKRLVGYDIEIKDMSISLNLDEQEVKSLLEQEISLIKLGEVKIEKIARQRNQITKVLISSEIHSNPSKLCIPLLKQAESKFSETLHLIDKCSDPKEQIIKALHPLDPQEVKAVTIEPQNNEVKVQVTTFQAQKNGVGKNGTNVKLATQLLQYSRITIII